MCSVKVVRKPFSEHLSYLKEKGIWNWEENLEKYRERAAQLMQAKYGVDVTKTVDIPASFDGYLCSQGWTANEGIVSAIAEILAQVIEISYKIKAVHSVM